MESILKSKEGISTSYNYSIKSVLGTKRYLINIFSFAHILILQLLAKRDTYSERVGTEKQEPWHISLFESMGEMPSPLTNYRP